MLPGAGHGVISRDYVIVRSAEPSVDVRPRKDAEGQPGALDLPARDPAAVPQHIRPPVLARGLRRVHCGRAAAADGARRRGRASRRERGTAATRAHARRARPLLAIRARGRRAALLHAQPAHGVYALRPRLPRTLWPAAARRPLRLR